ncbi:hypothetical protein ACOMCU_22475 [Lysinibacillus sp. UGB7]|uniref:hypothetical protein n=1 Tax=Lysinibacillus sp. UGB7 TaxID=3411039 RepID=UPI003B7B5BEC
MENTLVATSNDKIAEQLKNAMFKSKDIIKAICSQEEGFIDIFIRKGNVSKLLYQKFQFDSMKVNFDEMNDDFQLKTEKEFEVPIQIYRRFTYLLSTAITYSPKMEHGHIRFAFKFRKMENDLWQEDFHMEFIAEKPFRNGEMMPEYD